MLECLKYGQIILCVVGLVIVVTCIIAVSIDKHCKNKAKKDEDLKEQEGIKSRWADIGFGFYICKVHDNEIYYLNNDGYYYNTKTNAKEFIFNTAEELENYIKDNEDDIKSMYGDVRLSTHKRRIYLGYCKKL